MRPTGAKSATSPLYLGIVNYWCDNHFRVSIEESLCTAADVGGSYSLDTKDRSRCYDVKKGLDVFIMHILYLD